MNDNLKNDNKATRFPHNDPTKGGRKPSIDKQIKKLLLDSGKMIIKSKNVVSISKNGDVIIEVPTEMQVAMNLMRFAVSNKGSDSLKAIQMIMDRVDGKVNFASPQEEEKPPTQLIFTTEEEKGEMEKLIKSECKGNGDV